jgi:hypothetical protein
MRRTDASLRLLVDAAGNQCFGKLWRLASGKKVEPQTTQITQMGTNEARINELSNRVIGCALAVAGTLGSGFVEKVYENALAQRAAQERSRRGATTRHRRHVRWHHRR